MPTRHMHAEFINKWAEGHLIQEQRPLSNEWYVIANPCWGLNYKYRLHDPLQRFSHERYAIAMQHLERLSILVGNLHAEGGCDGLTEIEEYIDIVDSFIDSIKKEK